MKWIMKSRAWPWWQWLALAGCLVVLGLDTVAFELSGHADWRQHLRFSNIVHALTGLEIFIVLPLLNIATRRHQARLASRSETAVDPGHEGSSTDADSAK
jgi:hypothetical protein